MFYFSPSFPFNSSLIQRSDIDVLRTWCSCLILLLIIAFWFDVSNRGFAFFFSFFLFFIHSTLFRLFRVHIISSSFLTSLILSVFTLFIEYFIVWRQPPLIANILILFGIFICITFSISKIQIDWAYNHKNQLCKLIQWNRHTALKWLLHSQFIRFVPFWFFFHAISIFVYNNFRVSFL